MHGHVAEWFRPSASICLRSFRCPFFRFSAEHGGTQLEPISNRVIGSNGIGGSFAQKARAKGEPPGRSLASRAGPRARGPGLVVVCAFVLAVLAGFAAMLFLQCYSTSPRFTSRLACLERDPRASARGTGAGMEGVVANACLANALQRQGGRVCRTQRCLRK